MGEVKQHQPPMTIDEQIENLKNIGLIVEDEEYAKRILNDISYLNNPVPVSLLSGDRKPQIRFLGNHPSGSGNLYHKSFRM